MARQEQIFAETIVAMKKATARRDDASDSDDSIRRPTNRGYKLKRKAKYTEPGRLDTTDGPRSFKQRILYNGFSRSIMTQNPPRVDADGDVIDEPEDDSDADLTPAEDDPFAEIQLHNLLMPLTAASDLKQHPSLSVPYTSKAIDDMIQNAQDILHREQEALWRIKHVSSEFRGDHTWVPCGAFQSDNDAFFLTQFPSGVSGPASVEHETETAPLSSAANWDTMSNVRLMADLEEASMDGASLNAPHDAYQAPEIPKESGKNQTTELGVKRQDQVNPSQTSEEIRNGISTISTIGSANTDDKSAEKIAMEQPQSLVSAHNRNGNAPESATATAIVEAAAAAAAAAVENDQPDTSSHAAQTEDIKSDMVLDTQITEDIDTKMEGAEADGDPDDSTYPSHRMTTRTRARAATVTSSPSTQSLRSSPEPSQIHPMFLVPPSVLPNPNMGLPPEQADETRRLLCSYVQRQEEVCRGVEALYVGLLRAKRMRDEVMEWCTAEGHIGEMSDGEDWVDHEEWKLAPDDLKKGEEVEEEEDPAKAGKKTRNRRQVA